MRYVNQLNEEVKIFDISCKGPIEFIKKYYYDPSNEILMYHSFQILISELERFGWCCMPDLKNKLGVTVGFKPIKRKKKSEKSSK